MAAFTQLRLRVGSNSPAGSAGTLSAHPLSSATNGLHWMFQTPEPVTISRVMVQPSAINAPPNYRASLQAVSAATGRGDGTVLGGASPASVVFNPAALGWAVNVNQWLALDNPYPAARGQLLALVLDYVSGTVGGANNISAHYSVSGREAVGIPYAVTVSAGTPAKQSAEPVFAYGSALKVYGQPLTATGTQSISSGAVWGLKFSLPATLARAYTLLGARWHGALLAAGGVVTQSLYKGATQLGAVTLDTDIFSGTSARSFDLFFASAPTLRGDEPYYLGLSQSIGGTNSFIFNTLGAAADRAAYPLGENVALAQFSAGSWADTLTRLPILDLIVAGVNNTSEASYFLGM